MPARLSTALDCGGHRAVLRSGPNTALRLVRRHIPGGFLRRSVLLGARGPVWTVSIIVSLFFARSTRLLDALGVLLIQCAHERHLSLCYVQEKKVRCRV